MGRPKKLKIKKDTDCILNLMQEIYNDCNLQRKNLKEDIETRKKKFTLEDIAEDSILSKANTDQYKLLDKVTERKLVMVKLLSDMIVKQSDGNQSEEVTEQEMSEIYKMIQEK